MKPWGCYSRADYLSQYTIHGISKENGLPVSTTIPHVMSRDCQYTLSHPGDKDARCEGCSRKQTMGD